MKTLSYIIDLSVFFILIGAFEVNWIIAFIISEVVGFSIRAMFVGEEDESVEPEVE